MNKPNKSRNSEPNEQSPRNIFEIFSCSWAPENFSRSRGLRTDISQKTVVGCPCLMPNQRRIYFLEQLDWPLNNPQQLKLLSNQWKAYSLGDLVFWNIYTPFDSTSICNDNIYAALWSPKFLLLFYSYQCGWCWICSCMLLV